MPDQKVTIGIVGAAGAIGAALSAALHQKPYVARLMLQDVRRSAVLAIAMDLALVAAWHPTAEVLVGDTPDLRQCEVIVCCASIAHRDGLARADMLQPNSRIVHGLVTGLTADWAGTLVVVTNPVDPFVYTLSRLLPRARVIGFTANDTARLRASIGTALGVAPHRVIAWSLGEHGPHAVPVLSQVRLDGQRITLTEKARRAVVTDTTTWYARWQQLGTGLTTAWASSQGLVTLLDALTGFEPCLTTASLPLNGHYGIDNIAVSILARIDRKQMEVLDLKLSDEELDDMRQAAEVTRRLTDDTATTNDHERTEEPL